MPEPAILELIRDRLGLDAASIGADCVLRAIERRMELTRRADSAEYGAFAAESPGEFDALIDELVVPETWFFRDREPFRLLAKIATEKWRTAPRIRVLSAPCSTGEEAYSIAITLAESGFQADRILVDAADISARALDAARGGLYGPASFRGHALERHACWFEPLEKGMRVRPAAADRVRFFKANIADPAFGADGPPYHAIFCRNLLIYLTAEARARVLPNMDRLLMPGGLLVCGHAEMGIVRALGLPFAPQPGAFACFKPERGSRARPAPEPAGPPAATPADARDKKAEPREKHQAPGNASRKPAQETAPQQPSLERIRTLADQGHLGQARKICLDFIAANPPDPEAFFLLGLIHEAAGRPNEAEEAYGKALYLAPAHLETLVNLLLLCERRGAKDQARVLRERIERIEGRGGRREERGERGEGRGYRGEGEGFRVQGSGFGRGRGERGAKRF